MSSNFPGAIDSFTNPTATQPMNAPSHSAIETAQNSAISAIENTVGVTASSVASSLTYLVTNPASLDPGLKLTPSISLKTSGTPSAGTFLRGDNTWSSPSKFGGTGVDGVLSLTSGTTTVNLSNAGVYIKNYSSISITGTALLNFSNPNTNGTIIIFRVSGNVTLTSSNNPNIEISGLGAAGGNGGGAGGGKGGGAILIECGGVINITGNINANGIAGTNGSAAVGNGGGGGGGTIWVIYNSSSANSGLLNVNAGATGTGSSGSGGGGNGVNGSNSFGYLGILPGGNGGNIANSTTATIPLNTITASILATRYIPLIPGAGGGSGDTNSTLHAGGTGTGVGTSNAGFSAYVQNVYF